MLALLFKFQLYNQMLHVFLLDIDYELINPLWNVCQIRLSSLYNENRFMLLLLPLPL